MREGGETNQIKQPYLSLQPENEPDPIQIHDLPHLSLSKSLTYLPAP